MQYWLTELKYKKPAKPQNIQKEESGLYFLGRTYTCQEGVKKNKVQMKLELEWDGKLKKDF